MHKASDATKSAGFTIIELMIATLIFSVVLLLITTGIMQVARVYYKGVTESNTQQTARTIVDTISQAIQFDGGNITTPAGALPKYQCVNNQQFAYWPGKQLVDGTPVGNQTNHAIVQRTAAGCAAPPSPITGRELLSPNMRLSDLTITPVPGTTNLYQIHVVVVYGDDDLLNNPTAANASCKNITAGTQFCARTDLTATVQKRVK